MQYGYMTIDEIRVPYPFLRDLLRDHRLESSMQFYLPCDRSQVLLDGVHAIGEK